MRFNLISLVIIITLLVDIVLIYQGMAAMEKETNPEEKFIVRTTMAGQILGSKHEKEAVMIVAFRDFRDPEYFVPKQILEEAGISVKTASNEMGTAVGTEGGKAKVDLLVSDIRASDFDAVVFIGGPGALDSLDNEVSYQVAKETILRQKVLASICVSPVILAKAGVLQNKRATVWRSAVGTENIIILEQNEAIYTPQSVVVDGRIITADGPKSAESFGQTIVEALTVQQ